MSCQWCQEHLKGPSKDESCLHTKEALVAVTCIVVPGITLKIETILAVIAIAITYPARAEAVTLS